MDIVLNLKKFFAEQQDEAAIPGLGVFYKSESEILFIEKTPRSNAFVNFFGYEENLTENESVEVIERWVSNILNDLKTQKVANIPELGTFEIKKDKVIFKPAADQNSSYTAPEEYGLEELPKSNTSTGSVSKPNKTPKKSIFSELDFSKPIVLWSVIGAIVVILFLGLLITYKTSPRFQFWVAVQQYKMQEGFNKTRKQQAQPIVITPVVPVFEEIDEFFDDEVFVETPQTQPSEITSKPEVITQTQSAQQPAKPAQTATSQLPFKVIGGAFGVKTNADNFSAEMRKDGFQVEVIFDRERQLHLVSLGAFRTMNEALEFKEKIRTTRDIGCWVFRQQ
jgi:cell division septation protein DedD